MFLRGSYPPPVCMEEEEGGGQRWIPWSSRATERTRKSLPDEGAVDFEDEKSSPGSALIDESLMRDFLMKLMDERRAILDSKLSARAKARLLETSRYPLSAVTGRSIRIFQSEYIVYAILIFSLVVLLSLAWLTAYAGLPKEVTIAFVGTVVGGTTATVAQKLGRL